MLNKVEKAVLLDGAFLFFKEKRIGTEIKLDAQGLHRYAEYRACHSFQSMEKKNALEPKH